MDKASIEIMWDIDYKLQLGDNVTDKGKEYYNLNLESMIEEMRENYYHWADQKQVSI